METSPPKVENESQSKAETTTEEEEFVKVATLDELKVDGARKRLPVKDRDVTVIRCGDDIFAIDSVCYRKWIVTFFKSCRYGRTFRRGRH